MWGATLLGVGVLWLLDASGAPVAYPRVIAITLMDLPSSCRSCPSVSTAVWSVWAGLGPVLAVLLS